MKGIIIQNLSKSFEKQKVLSNFSHCFEYGSRTCVMAPSGEGKTTLFNIIMGLIPKDSGDIKGVPKHISAVFQEERLCESFSVIGNIIAVTGKSRSISEIEKCLSLLGLSDSMQKKVYQLSGGMKRRVAIARALLAESSLVIMDEPFKGLDESLHKQTASVILEYTKGKTLIISTHDSNDAMLLNAQILNI